MARFTDPIEVRGLRLKHRILMSAMTTSRAEEDGSPSAWSRAHYAERARGGAAVCFSEAAFVNREGKGFPNQLGAHSDAIVPGLRRLGEEVGAAGAPFALQLFHAGRTALSAITGTPIVGPSPIPHPTEEEVPRELSAREVKETARAFGEAARRAREAGLRMLEIHGATWYLCQQFFSPASNQRTDEYGGSLPNRMRFPLEVAEAVRRGAGGEMVVSYRLGLLEPWEGGFTAEDTLALAPALLEAGVDILHCSRNARVGVPVKPEFYNPAFARLRKAVRAPLAANGAAFGTDRLQAYMEMGADFVAVARGMLTDPHYAAKAVSGRGGEILRCIECKPCIYMRDSRCPDEAYPGGLPESMKGILGIAAGMKAGGYAPTAKKRARVDDPVEKQGEGSSVS
ncbi:MAG: NADH:flavin oxidoreductase [Candidatus Tectomicrobia bacterium]|uniref:NADH:flavin oxidoreductase n=1 Tax=Tectimicrobiota bacterium TaxID=2528274 RepID=A0A932I367_UNCTE|nr:NADH:flavin oxidoreductase [Candidatus Tectomicrobia bacterium]